MTINTPARSVETMKVQEVTRQLRLQEWAEQIRACRQSGSTVREWCKGNGVSTKTYYNRMKRVREELLEAMEAGSALTLCGRDGRSTLKQMETPEFAALPIPRMNMAAVTVHIGPHVAEIHNGAETETVESVLRALARL